jgi:hypothetical protein
LKYLQKFENHAYWFRPRTRTLSFPCHLNVSWGLVHGFAVLQSRISGWAISNVSYVFASEGEMAVATGLSVEWDERP